MDSLIEAALQARDKAQAPYSNFQVGCALEGEDGTIYPGCNVESASYGLTMCAERGAIYGAMARGAKPRSFRRIVVCADTDDLTPPCGACRQVLWEYCGDIPLTLVNLKGKHETLRVSHLLPRAFDASILHQSGAASGGVDPSSGSAG